MVAARLLGHGREGAAGATLQKPPAAIAYSEPEGDDGEASGVPRCRPGLEGVVSKRIDRRYLPGDRGVWVKCSALAAPSS
jgi:hypothetical protein